VIDIDASAPVLGSLDDGHARAMLPDEAVDSSLAPADGRLGRAPGTRCTITVVRR